MSWPILKIYSCHCRRPSSLNGSGETRKLLKTSRHMTHCTSLSFWGLSSNINIRQHHIIAAFCPRILPNMPAWHPSVVLLKWWLQGIYVEGWNDEYFSFTTPMTFVNGIIVSRGSTTCTRSHKLRITPRSTKCRMSKAMTSYRLNGLEPMSGKAFMAEGVSYSLFNTICWCNYEIAFCGNNGDTSWFAISSLLFTVTMTLSLACRCVCGCPSILRD